MMRSRRCMYSLRTMGNNAHTSAGGGGHSGGCRADRANCRLLCPAAAAATAAVAAAMGGVEGQGKRRGTSGEVVQRTSGVREAMSEMGIKGRLIHACHGQRVGLDVSRARNMSGPRNSRTAKAP